MSIDNRDGPHYAVARFIVCPNRQCRKFTFGVSLHLANRDTTGRLSLGGPIQQWRLIPFSEAKVFPDYVPRAIREDYQEACLIRDLSPKASATLARRCLQGMIRDFWGIQMDRLVDEVNALRERVDPLVWKAIDSVTSVGNIGAHMEKDVNLIVDIEPNEAAQLIGLIEMLIKEWYVSRHEREERLEAVVAIGKAKAETKAPSLEATTGTSAPSPETTPEEEREPSRPA